MRSAGSGARRFSEVPWPGDCRPTFLCDCSCSSAESAAYFFTSAVRFLLAAGFRQVGWYILDPLAPLFYLLGALLLFFAVVEYRRRGKS